MNKNEPWYHIKDLIGGSVKEVVGGLKDIALMLGGEKERSDSKKKKK